MTILHVTDFHFNKAWFCWLLEAAPPHDLLVLSGDLLDQAAATSPRDQARWVAAWAQDYAAPLCLCSGNHDLQWDARAAAWSPAYWLRELANHRTWVDGQRFTFDGLRFLPIGCTTKPKGGPDADIWVVHAPPSQTSVARRASGREGGDPELLASCRRHQPVMVLSGHVHDAVQWHDYDGRTLCLNPGRHANAGVPPHILIDTVDLTCRRITADTGASMSVVPPRSLCARIVQPPPTVIAGPTLTVPTTGTTPQTLVQTQ